MGDLDVVEPNLACCECAACKPKDEDADARLHKLTNGRVDVAFEVTGVPVVLQQAIDSTLFIGESIVSIWRQ